MTLPDLHDEPGSDSNTEAVSLPSLYLDFDWSNERLWALALPVVEIPISEIDWHLRIPIWSTVPGRRLFNLRPIQVIENPHAHRWHFDRIQAASTDFPIDMIWSAGRHVILDGVHRLAKLWMFGAKVVLVRRLAAELAPLIASSDYPDD